MNREDLNVIAAMLDDPLAWHYGLVLSKAAGITVGTVYPVLARLEKSGWLESRWEKGERQAPRRRLYRLTGLGQRAMVTAVEDQSGARPKRPRRRLGFGLPRPTVQLG
jgi:DNA-binding MarR family transcriptional regulator